MNASRSGFYNTSLNTCSACQTAYMLCVLLRLQRCAVPPVGRALSGYSSAPTISVRAQGGCLGGVGTVGRESSQCVPTLLLPTPQ